MKNFFESLNVKSLLVWLVIISLGVLGAGLAVKAYNGQLFGDCNNCTINVQGAVEAAITFVADGENIGDYIEVYGNGTDWLIGSSGALTSSKMTCTTST